MPVSIVYEICNAYESGFGHGEQSDGKNGDCYSDPELNEAYQYGYSAGEEAQHVNIKVCICKPNERPSINCPIHGV